MNNPTEIKWPDYPPITQGDERSTLYRRLVERHEHDTMLRARVPMKAIEFRVDAEVLPRLCALSSCRRPIPKDAKHDKKYCTTECARRASKIRQEEAAAARANGDVEKVFARAGLAAYPAR